MDSDHKETLYLNRAKNELDLANAVFKISIGDKLKLDLELKKDATFFSNVVSNSYYCIFYSAKAFLYIKGIITTPPDEHRKTLEEFEKLAEEYEISIINLIAPNTKEERAKEILNNEKKFTYLVSVAGTTGARGEVSEQSLEFVKKIRPLAPNGQLFVGFGISNAEQAKKFVQAGADGVIVGSEIINIYSKYIVNGKIDENKVLEEIEKFAEVIQSA